jgi:hypothetical protein
VIHCCIWFGSVLLQQSIATVCTTGNHVKMSRHKTRQARHLLAMPKQLRVKINNDKAKTIRFVHPEVQMVARHELRHHLNYRDASSKRGRPKASGEGRDYRSRNVAR